MALYRTLETDLTPQVLTRPTPSRDERHGPRPEPPPAEARKRKPEQKRLASVDAFRGLTILGMLLVNNIALGRFAPAQLVHAGWGQGVHFADMIFPWFLLISGLSIPLAAAKHQRRGLGRNVWVIKVFTRTLTLVTLGCLVDSSIKGQVFIGLGVLQLIGLSYCVAALLAELSQVSRLLVAATLFLTHWAFVRYWPIPDVGSGSFTEAQNFVTWLNDTYLKAYHMEGLFSVVSTSAIVIVGTIMGDALRREDGVTFTEVFYLFMSGAVLTTLGWAWSHDTPYSKPMWTSSYLLFTGGCGLMVLAFFRLTVDMTRVKWWVSPLLVFGANAITVYVIPILFKMLVMQRYHWPLENGAWVTLQQALQREFWIGHYGAIDGGWGYTISYIVFWWLFLLLLYRNKLFLRV